jgi:hypothetical protein
MTDDNRDDGTLRLTLVRIEKERRGRRITVTFRRHTIASLSIVVSGCKQTQNHAAGDQHLRSYNYQHHHRCRRRHYYHHDYVTIICLLLPTCHLWSETRLTISCIAYLPPLVDACVALVDDEKKDSHICCYHSLSVSLFFNSILLPLPLHLANRSRCYIKKEQRRVVRW